MRIEIVPAKAQKKAATGTWLEFWEGHAKKKAAKCSVIGCENPATLGTQVVKPSVGSVTFIVPLCAVHAENSKETMDVAESTVFVLAKK